MLNMAVVLKNIVYTIVDVMPLIYLALWGVLYKCPTTHTI